jgi:hypothetical protein
MDMNERQIALSVLESLRGDLMYAHLNFGNSPDRAVWRHWYEMICASLWRFWRRITSCGSKGSFNAPYSQITSNHEPVFHTLAAGTLLTVLG